MNQIWMFLSFWEMWCCLQSRVFVYSCYKITIIGKFHENWTFLATLSVRIGSYPHWRQFLRFKNGMFTIIFIKPYLRKPTPVLACVLFRYAISTIEMGFFSLSTKDVLFLDLTQYYFLILIGGAGIWKITTGTLMIYYSYLM